MITLPLVPSLFCDVVWPALVLEQRLLSAIPITAGLIVECLVLRFCFQLTWKRAITIDLAMNLVSTLVGMLLIPLIGLSAFIFDFVRFGEWICTFLIAVLLTTGIEASVVSWGFKVPVDNKRFWWLLVGNAISVSLAFVGLFRHLQ
jgi:hypothetical protein